MFWNKALDMNIKISGSISISEVKEWKLAKKNSEEVGEWKVDTMVAKNNRQNLQTVRNDKEWTMNYKIEIDEN